MMLGISINRVQGHSMSPALPDNSYAIFHRFFRVQNLKVKDVVKVEHPKFGLLVKRIKFIDRNGFIWLEGLDPHSISSMEMGPIKSQHILAKLAKVFAPVIQIKTQLQ
ncbi:hypothetical protein HR060_14495 [Catenovulum sp. SM1970]|uniref:S24 family peptidase n=1 Tax=Marinifaba aquimaris TaxID=2741323 RepID=UPI0015733BB3|nr:S24 family peptidase [Marinifaba aquimaris]NTS78066.1 hypothetical protein [Marinifaba aquimaris]